VPFNTYILSTFLFFRLLGSFWSRLTDTTRLSFFPVYRTVFLYLFLDLNNCEQTTATYAITNF